MYLCTVLCFTLKLSTCRSLGVILSGTSFAVCKALHVFFIFTISSLIVAEYLFFVLQMTAMSFQRLLSRFRSFHEMVPVRLTRWIPIPGRSCIIIVCFYTYLNFLGTIQFTFPEYFQIFVILTSIVPLDVIQSGTITRSSADSLDDACFTLDINICNYKGSIDAERLGAMPSNGIATFLYDARHDRNRKNDFGA